MANFCLIETLLWTPSSGFARLPLHLQRLRLSAQQVSFTVPFDPESALAAAVIRQTVPLRVRLTLSQGGVINVTTSPFHSEQKPCWNVAIAQTRLRSNDHTLRIKSTQRDVFVRARAEFSDLEAGEVLLLNEKDELCEGTISSLFVARDAMLWTPPISCGLLPGVLRADLIASGKAKVGKLYTSDLVCHPFFVGNSLRGLIPARLVRS